MAGETRQPLTCVFYLIDRETGETKRIDKVPPEALEKMSKRLSENMSAYYTRHMDEYVLFPFPRDAFAASRDLTKL